MPLFDTSDVKEVGSVFCSFGDSCELTNSKWNWKLQGHSRKDQRTWKSTWFECAEWYVCCSTCFFIVGKLVYSVFGPTLKIY